LQAVSVAIANLGFNIGERRCATLPPSSICPKIAVPIFVRLNFDFFHGLREAASSWLRMQRRLATRFDSLSSVRTPLSRMRVAQGTQMADIVWVRLFREQLVSPASHHQYVTAPIFVSKTGVLTDSDRVRGQSRHSR
jgi:hypothetical protein